MNIETQWKNFVKAKPLPNPARSTILVVNPAPSRSAKRVVAGPLSQARKGTRSASTNQERKTMATAKQIAARKRFAAMARSGAFKKGRKRSKKARNPTTTTSRPRVSVTATGKGKKKSYKFSLGRKSPYKGRTTSVNPRRRRSSKRRNPSRAGGRKLLGFLDLKSVISFGLGAAGFIGGVKGLQFVAKIPGFGPKADGTPGTLAPYRGGVYLLVALFALAKVKNTMIRDAAVGVGIAGVYDLVAVNVKAANIATLAGADYSLVGYDPMLGEDVGFSDMNNLNGSSLGADATLLGADMSAVY